jgi:hypothetical protein
LFIPLGKTTSFSQEIKIQYRVQIDVETKLNKLMQEIEKNIYFDKGNLDQSKCQSGQAVIE